MKADPADIQQAVSLLKELLVKGPCDAEMAQIKSLLESCLSQLVKPALEKDREKQSQLERLIKQIQSTRELDLNGVAQRLGEIAPWITDPPDWRARERSSDAPGDFPAKLLEALRHMGQGDAWLAGEVEKLASGAQPTAQTATWTALAELLARIVKRDELGQAAWRAERAEFKQSLLELAQGMGESLRALGRSEGEVDGVLERLRSEESGDDLQALKKALLKEAQAFQTHSRSLGERLERDRERLEQARNRLREMDAALMSARDEQLQEPGTGLPNRYAYLGHLERQISRARHLKEPFALLLLHLDHLAGVLGGMSEQRGDRLVAGLAKHFRGVVGEHGFLARLSEERFALLMPGAAAAVAQERGQALLTLFERIRTQLGGKDLRIRASVGGSIFLPDWNGEGITRRAEIALGLARRRPQAPHLHLYDPKRDPQPGAEAGEGSGAFDPPGAD
ncbi:putative diguanylate cyclase [Magnetofaba australis IT-1]|uniref:Putative diguanylate cyclase n=1 Tax=Magnetofaba australis IT-1 TaxID=1434232 RepID=A0A1Y2K7Q4_9PROT|nr:putative diguanylate cyclase [Magnetofaba australis IT-1]